MRWVLDETAPWFDADWTRSEIARRREELRVDPSDQQLVDYVDRLEADLALIERSRAAPQNSPVSGLRV